MLRSIRCAPLLLALAAPMLRAQAPARADLAVSYIAHHSIRADTADNFWAQGGRLELGADAFHGLGVAAAVTGVHTNSIGAAGVPLSLVIATFGPRYRWHNGHRVSAYGEALLGEADGFGSLFPGATAAGTSASSLALQVGGAVDLALTPHLAVRAVQASWLRTQLPNGTNNRQNNLQVGAGLVLRFGR